MEGQEIRERKEESGSGITCRVVLPFGGVLELFIG